MALTRNRLLSSANSAPVISFSKIFNLTGLRRHLRYPILEWSDVKRVAPDASIFTPPSSSDPSLEAFGCWSTSARKLSWDANVSRFQNYLHLDYSYTHPPAFAYYTDGMHTTFAGLIATIIPGHPHPEVKKGLPLLQKSRLGSTLPPDEQLACFDFLYFVTSGFADYEFEKRWSPVWNLVGTHLRFTDELMELGKAYARRAFGLDTVEDLPPVSSLAFWIL